MADNPQSSAAAASAASPAQVASKALADAAAEAERLQLDEAGPDHYFLVNGQKVNAWGEVLDSPEAKRRPR